MVPIALIKVDDLYFVQDGHHRVAISAAGDQQLIAANVTELRHKPAVTAS
ncbi:MAG: hypothetical protein R3293_13070 [Candidatus Promineifilaceae bacterium]|nr:hypothetical protein [Candidatus Promineifilaceae bacterium]